MPHAATWSGRTERHHHCLNPGRCRSEQVFLPTSELAARRERTPIVAAVRAPDIDSSATQRIKVDARFFQRPIQRRVVDQLRETVLAAAGTQRCHRKELGKSSPTVREQHQTDAAGIPDQLSLHHTDGTDHCGQSRMWRSELDNLRRRRGFPGIRNGAGCGIKSRAVQRVALITDLHVQTAAGVRTQSRVGGNSISRGDRRIDVDEHPGSHVSGSDVS